MLINSQQYRQDIIFLESIVNLPNKNQRRRALLRMKNFLALVDNPQAKLKFIHVAGTSGKGTVVNLLHNLISDAGYRVGCYTSPFATTSIEKIKINNQYIHPDDLHNILEKKIKPALDLYTEKFHNNDLTYFEVFLSLTLVYFQQQKCQWVILEAGLGGKHDGTNIIPSPQVAVITNVGLDHTDVLGATKKLIAQDKAGIIKAGSKFFTNEKQNDLVKIFQTTCQRQRAKFITLKDLSDLRTDNNYFATKQQRKNLNLVLNVLTELKIKPKHLLKTVNNFQLLCRQEIIQNNPRVILDGAHNFNKLKNLIEFTRQQKYNQLYLILGFSANKNYQKILPKLLQITDYLYLTRFLITFRKSADLAKLAGLSRRLSKKPVRIFHDPRQALKSALKSAKKNDLIVITGSFFLAGELRKNWISEDYILQNLIAHRK